MPMRNRIIMVKRERPVLVNLPDGRHLLQDIEECCQI